MRKGNVRAVAQLLAVKRGGAGRTGLDTTVPEDAVQNFGKQSFNDGTVLGLLFAAKRA